MVESIWGVSALAQGHGSDGFGAALWRTDRIGSVERLRPASNSTHVISVWTSGSTVSELYLDKKLRFRRVRRRGTFQLARAGEDVRVLLSQSTGTCLDLYVPTSMLDSVLENDMEMPARSLELLPLKLETDSMITSVADAVAAEIRSPGLASRMAMDSAVLQLGVGLIRRWSNFSGSVREPGAGLNHAQIKKTVEYLRDTLHLDVSLDDLARRLGLSTFHFARAFKTAMGVPPHRYRLRLRLEKARELIELSDLSIGEIASHVGYQDASFFSRAFRREFGISPGAHRRFKLAAD